MLAKKYRLPIQEFVGKNGKIIRTPFFLIKIFPNQFFYSRFGVIISKKVAVKATVRNKIKRIIFSAVNPKNNRGLDFLIIVSPRIKDLKKEEIIKQLQKIAS